MAIREKDYNPAKTYGAVSDDSKFSDLGDLLDENGNEIVELDTIASAVNNIGIRNAATGNNPVVYAAGEDDTGIELHNNQSEEIAIFNSIASAVNEFTIANAATGSGPQLEATGGDTNINVEIIPKGNGYVDIQGGLQQEATQVTANTDAGTASTIEDGATAVEVAGVTTDANDFIVLPSLADVPVGHTIKIACNAGSNFELRTPASSNEKINNVDSDGTQEYLCTDTDTIIIWKLSDSDGWVAQSITILGAVRSAVVPD